MSEFRHNFEYNAERQVDARGYENVPDNVYDPYARQRILDLLGNRLTPIKREDGEISRQSVSETIISINKSIDQIGEIDSSDCKDTRRLKALRDRFQELISVVSGLKEAILKNRRLDLHVHADYYLDLGVFIKQVVESGVVALINTDHNSLYNQPKLRRLAEKEGLLMPFDGTELTLLDRNKNKFHLKLYSDPADYDRLEPIIKELCQVSTPPLASDFLGVLEREDVRYWAVIAHPGDEKMGIGVQPAIDLIKRHNVHIETEHPAHSPQKRRFWRRVVVNCNNHPDIDRPVYAEGGSDFHHQIEGKRFGWGMITKEKIKLSFEYLDVVGDYFAALYSKQECACVESEDYLGALKSTAKIAQLVPLNESSYQRVVYALSKLINKNEDKCKLAREQTERLDKAASRRELLLVLADLEPVEGMESVLEGLISGEHGFCDPDVCREALLILAKIGKINNKDQVMALAKQADTLPDVKIAALGVLEGCANPDDINCLWNSWRPQKEDPEMRLENAESCRLLKHAMQRLLAVCADSEFFIKNLGSDKMSAYEAGVLFSALSCRESGIDADGAFKFFFNENVRRLARRFPYLQVVIYDLACKFNVGSAAKILENVHDIVDQNLADELVGKSDVLCWSEINRHLAKQKVLIDADPFKKRNAISSYPVMASREAFHKGLMCLGEGDRLEALEALQRAFRLDQGITEELLSCVSNWLARDDPALARELIMSLPPLKSAEFWFLRAELALKFEDYNEAINSANRYLKLEHDLKPGHNVQDNINRTKRNLALALWRIGSKDRANKTLSDLLKAEPNNYNNLILGVELDPSKDSEVFQRIQSVCPNEPVSLRLVSNGLLREGRWEEVIEVLLSGMTINKGNRFLQINLARAYDELGKYKQAFDHWLAAYKLNPRHPFLIEKVKKVLLNDVFLRRRCARLAHDFELSIPEFSVSEGVLNNDTQKRDALVAAVINCVKSQCIRGNWAWAMNACKIISKENLLSGMAKEAYVTSLLHVGHAALVSGMPNKVEETMRDVLIVEPRCARARHYLGAAYAIQNKHTLAANECLRAWRLSPKSRVLIENLVRELELIGDTENAARFQEKLQRFEKSGIARPLEPIGPVLENEDFSRNQKMLGELIATLDNTSRELASVFSPLLS